MIVVVVVGAGAGWESRALGLLAADRGLVVLKRCVDVDDLLATASTGQADVAVVGAEIPGLDGSVVEALAEHDVRLVAVAHDVDAARARAARIGLAEVIAADRLEELPETLRRPPAVRTGPGDAELPPDPTAMPTPPVDAAGRGRVIAVWGAGGAPGRTTVAIGIAAELARRGLSTVLVDADPYGGSVAQHLGILDEVSGLLAAARLAAAGAMSERYAEVARRLSDRLRVVTGLPRPDRWREIRPGALEQLVECARAGAQVVLDTGFSLEVDPGADVGLRAERNGLTHEAIGVADEVVVVGAADPVGLARLARAIRELGEYLDRAEADPSTGPVGPRGPGGSGASDVARPATRVVVNRMRPSLGWRESDVVSMLAGFGAGEQVHFLPEDQPSVDRALVAGRSLVESGDSAITRATSALLDAMAGASATGVQPARRRTVRR